MFFNTFVQYNNIIPLLAPVDIADTETVTGYVDLKGAHNFAFFAYFGLLTSATALDNLVITVEGATAEGGTEAQLDFYYRKAAAAGANTWAAIASASVVTLYASVDDGVALWIEVNPDDLAANDYRYTRLRMVPTDLTACLPSVIGIVNPRYRMTTYTSVTASASA